MPALQRAGGRNHVRTLKVDHVAAADALSVRRRAAPRLCDVPQCSKLADRALLVADDETQRGDGVPASGPSTSRMQAESTTLPRREPRAEST